MFKFQISTLLIFFIAVVLLFGCGKDDQKTDTETKKDDTQNELTSETKEDLGKTQEKGDTLDKSVDKKSKSDMVLMKTNMGDIKIKLYMDKAPITAGNFRDLVDQGFYDGIIFHRVIDGFMIQGGDPTGTGTGGSPNTIPDEFGEGLKHNRKGILSMANSGPNTGTSQFFITLVPTPHLDGKHAIFGEVVEGMNVVEKIGKVEKDARDKPVKDVVMTKVTMIEEE
jgi:cyclophilin family peptidyl-prolyl cis-trans isomerase